jgi:Domain of unknown function (DUF1929)
MALVFNVVPDWTSSENQGANIALADLDHDGVPELIVLRVDNAAAGPNQGFYRLGRRFDALGNITSGWGPWIAVPQWNSVANQGAGIAVADFGNNGLGLVVFQVEHNEPGPNRGLYRIGRKLDGQGNVTSGWSDWQEVPGWASWRDQGAAIAIADLDGDGHPELFVFHIDDFHTDNPNRPNKGFYRVGIGLTQDGQVNNWSDWFEVDWFSWFNQGAGLAIADLDGNKRPEIIVFQIDDPPQENAGWFRVGWSLDQQGRVQDGWGPWVKFDGWGSWEDQGGGMALASFGIGRPKAVVFHVDNPPGLNTGLYATTDLKLDIDTAAQKGIWRLLPYFSEVLPVHAALLHTGKVLFFAGSGNNAFRFNSLEFGNVAKKIYTSVVWDPSKNIFDDKTFDHPATLKRPDGTVIDYFCCGHTLLSDGRVLVAGGTIKYDVDIVKGGMQPVPPGVGFAGIREILIFDPNPLKEDWTIEPPMARGRWYPTLIMLSDGSVLAASGLDEQAKGLNNNTIERNSGPGGAAWSKTRDFNLPLYPHLFQLRDGRLFYTGGKMDTPGDSVPLVFDPINATAAGVVNGLTDTANCNQCASVILPPAQDQKFMILGGGPEDDGPVRQPATHRVATIDFGSPNPSYHTKSALNHERMHVNAVLLPDRTVLAVGGGVTREASAQTQLVDPQGGREVFEAEIYDPTTNVWTITSAATIARLYHSVALLLPDGRVVSAGGNPDKGSQVNWLPPDPLEEMRLEIFSPPYFFQKNTRPVVQDVPEEIKHNSKIAIRTPQAVQVKWISLIRPGITTHSFNGTQRLVDVPFTLVPPDTLNADVPDEPNVAPPGWYMLFLTDQDGVPSIGHWVHLS